MKKLAFSACLLYSLLIFSCEDFGSPVFYGDVYFILPGNASDATLTAQYEFLGITETGWGSYITDKTGEMDELKAKYGNAVFFTKIKNDDKIYKERIDVFQITKPLVSENIDIVITVEFPDGSEQEYNCRIIVEGREGHSEYTIPSDGSNGITEIPIFFHHWHTFFI
jgi:hypothetical protein